MTNYERKLADWLNECTDCNACPVNSICETAPAYLQALIDYATGRESK